MKEKLLVLIGSIQQRYYTLTRSRIGSDERGFGMNELLSIAAALVVAGFVVIPGLRTFASKVIAALNNWWDTKIYQDIFNMT